MAIRDAARLASASVEVDLAIVGAGAAGIALAREFVGQPVRVALLESGDFTHRHRTQFLYRGENVGRDSISPLFSRLRRFGGSTVRWGGQCRPLDPIDFEAGWPFGYGVLEPFYRHAQRVCNLGRFDYDARNWEDTSGGPLPLASELLQTRVYQFSHPRDFGVVYRPELERASNVDVYLNANLVEIRTEPGARVSAMRVATINRREFEVRAKHYVLACGGIENARLLLASKDAHPHGLGNAYDLVGRYFMDHAYLYPGCFEPASPRFDRSFYVIEGYHQAGSEQRMHAAFSLSERVLREEGLNGCAVYLLRRSRYKTLPAYSSAGGLALNHVIEILQHRDAPGGRLRKSLDAMAGDFGNVCRTLRDRLKGGWRNNEALALRASVELTPCRESRVTLSPHKDRFGVPRPRIDWRLNESDKRGYERLLGAIRSEFPRLGLGRLVEHGQYGAEGWPRPLSSGKHHMGTTRMAVDSRAGVVDPHCQVHGIDNLHIVGSSVFPTGGYANPTLTIVALALRSAERLKARLANPRP